MTHGNVDMKRTVTSDWLGLTTRVLGIQDIYVRPIRSLIRISLLFRFFSGKISFSLSMFVNNFTVRFPLFSLFIYRPDMSPSFVELTRLR